MSSVNSGVWRRFKTLSRDHDGGAGVDGGLWLKNDILKRSQVLVSTTIPRP